MLVRVCSHLCMCFRSYPGNGKGHVEVLPSLQPEAPGSRANESDVVVAAHGLLDGCYIWSPLLLLASDDSDSRITNNNDNKALMTDTNSSRWLLVWRSSQFCGGRQKKDTINML